MKKTLFAAALAASIGATPALAQGQMGPGMMGAPGMMGPGTMCPMMGSGMMGPGMMGPGMMGPGMMGPGMMGPGMMGPGMMGGHGMMMGPYGALARLDLTAEQRAKIGEIRRELRGKQREAMLAMHAQHDAMQEAFEAPAIDDAAARKAHQAMAEAHGQMFEVMLETRKRIDAVLTPEQREQLRRAQAGYPVRP
jgi:Spy/CpxP family protein refolding chaperone